MNKAKLLARAAQHTYGGYLKHENENESNGIHAEPSGTGARETC